MSSLPASPTKNAAATPSPVSTKDEKTSELQKTPPHGMKGALGPSDGITPKPFLVGACVVLLVALLAAIIMFLVDWQRRRRMRMATSGALSIDPTAWARLRSSISGIKVPGLDPAHLPVAGGDELAMETHESLEWNHFSSEVSLCLRRAIELRTGMPLAESTTEEILALLAKRGHQLEVLTKEELQQILGRLDRVRFGGQKISQEEGSKILKNLVGWCDRLEHATQAGVQAGVEVTRPDQKATSLGNSPTIKKGNGELRVFD